MPKYTYKARDEQNRIITGAADGASVDDVIDSLTKKEYMPISIDELNFDGTRKNQSIMEKLNASFNRSKNKVPFKAVVFFTRQLATMIESGVPLAQALAQLAENEKPVFKKVILQVAEDISMGNSFSDAISKHPGAFNNMYVSVVRSGEVSGALDTVLDQMATYMENVEALRQKVKGALRYPIFIGAFVTLMVTAILWKLVPVFESMYSSFSAELPMPTQILISLSHLIKDQFLIMAGLIILFIILFKVGLSNKSFKMVMHTLVLKIPVYGAILKKNIYATFSRTMALLMESGTPILQAIEISGAVVGNLVFSAALRQAYEKLRTGESLSQALKDTKVFPVLVTQLVSTGEESGRIDDLLRKASEFYDREIKVTVESLASIIEPFLIIILGSVVGSILIALYMPIFSLGKLMGT